ncbi:MAG TPA: hypothetical protein VIE87_03190 [Pseudolabrys sp.]
MARRALLAAVALISEAVVAHISEVAVRTSAAAAAHILSAGSAAVVAVVPSHRMPGEASRHT